MNVRGATFLQDRVQYGHIDDLLKAQQCVWLICR